MRQADEETKLIIGNSRDVYGSLEGFGAKESWVAIGGSDEIRGWSQTHIHVHSVRTFYDILVSIELKFKMHRLQLQSITIY